VQGYLDTDAHRWISCLATVATNLLDGLHLTYSIASCVVVNSTFARNPLWFELFRVDHLPRYAGFHIGTSAGQHRIVSESRVQRPSRNTDGDS
jgi:hypothetical protein